MKLNIGENIRKNRTRLGWTQAQLAERLGTSVQSVSRWESGGGYPDMELLPELARTFAVSVDDLLGCGEVKNKRTIKERTSWVTDTIRSPDTDPAEAAAILRTVRTDYLQEVPIVCRSLYLQPFPERYLHDDRVMTELRLLVETYMEQGSNGFCKARLLEMLAQTEDDAHFDALTQKYPIDNGMSLLSLQLKRSGAKRDWERVRILQRKKRMCELHEFLNPRPFYPSEFPPGRVYTDAELPECSVEDRCRESEGYLQMIHAVSAVSPDDVHPISGDGLLDCWAYSRVNIGVKYAAQLSAVGEEERALTVLEDCAVLIEQAFDFPELSDSFRRGCSSREERIPVLCRGSYFFDMDVRRKPFGAGREFCGVSFVVEKEEPWDKCYLTLGSMDGRLGERLTSREMGISDTFRPSWLDPIRDHPRYKAVVERIQVCKDRLTNTKEECI